MEKLIYYPILMGLAIMGVEAGQNTRIKGLHKCGSLKHLRLYAPLFNQQTQSLTQRQKERYVLTGLKIYKGLLTLAIESHGHPLDQLSLHSPEIKHLFNDVESALNCQNFRKWAYQIKNSLESKKGQALEKRATQLFDNCSKLLQDIFIDSQATSQQCGSKEQLEYLKRFLTFHLTLGLRPTNLSQEEAQDLKLKNLKFNRAMVSFVIDSYKQQINLYSPQVRQLFRDIGDAIGCTNFEAWVDRIEQGFGSDEAAAINVELRKLTKEYMRFARKNFVVK
jgi:hypothetical protein